ncbi:MAG: septal ring lytic transglycosylase RlpA family protein [Acaryochloris sp. SU_5_25]|nr:septal ring lytic transglycosylase RlpA family protein [Acaryochloris sp. SU_5_25]
MSNKLVLTGLAAALTMSVVSALTLSEANPIQQTTTSKTNQSISETVNTPSSEHLKSSTTPPANASESKQTVDAIKVGDNQSPNAQQKDEAAIAEIHAHEANGRPAATLYVKDIPIATFLGPEDSAKAETTKVATVKSTPKEEVNNSQDPVWRATAVAAKINQFHRDGMKADTIRVIWDKERQSYVIQANKDHLLEMSKLTILPKTTQDMGDDALKITNLLRRQLGDAQPLTGIPGRPQPVATAPAYQISGEASWYGPGFHGNYTASGEVYNQNALTAAHKTLPFGTRVRVTNLYNGQSVVVRINDRGPFTAGRVIDLSQGAAQVIGVTSSGVAPVRVDILQ